MSTNRLFLVRNRMLMSILATLGWLVLLFGWMALAWGHLSFFQGLAGLGIATLLFVAFTGAMWVVELGTMPTAALLATTGWLSFALYWMAFAGGGLPLLVNLAILMVSLLACGGLVTVLWLVRPAEDCC